MQQDEQEENSRIAVRTDAQRIAHRQTVCCRDILRQLPTGRTAEARALFILLACCQPEGCGGEAHASN